LFILFFIGEPNNVVSLLVDESKNQMCFLVVGGSNQPEAFLSNNFVIKNPTSLKLHASVYDIIENPKLSKGSKEYKALTISFRSEVFNNCSGYLAENAADDYARTHFSNALLDLLTYSSVPFDRFYWTSPETRSFFESIPQQAPEDHKRAQRWMQLAAYFKSLQGSPASVLDGDKDICHFDGVLDEAKFLAVKFYSFIMFAKLLLFSSIEIF
jgi:hypothetical protein